MNDKQKIAILIEALQQVSIGKRSEVDRDIAINALKRIKKAPN